MRTPFAHLSAAVAMASASLPALAHDGHVHDGLAAGLAHPFGGVDHLLATLGLGVVAGFAAAAGRVGDRARALPVPVRRGSLLLRAAVAGALGLIGGALWGAVAPGLPGGAFEHAAAVSLLAVAIALLSIERLGAAGLGAFALAVAVPHGWLHATEGTGVAFFVGLAVASAALFGTGAAIGGAGATLRGPSARWITAGAYAGTFAWLVAGGLR